MGKNNVDPNVAIRLGPGNFSRIARRAGLDNIYVGRVCKGLREPSFDVARMIAEAAGVTLDELWEHTAQFRQVRTAIHKVS